MSTSNLDLLKKYNPVFVFNTSEEYWPCSVEYVMENSQLYNDDKKILEEGQVTSNILASNIGNHLNINSRIYPGSPLDKIHLKHNIPLYCKVNTNEQFIDLIYIVFFAYNGPFNVLGFNTGEHQADIEHVVIRLSAETKKPIAIFFSAHGIQDGVWVKYEQVQKYNHYPVVYVAKFSHAMYPKASTWYRIFFLANDHTDDGVHWLSNNLVVLTEDNPVWVKYTGTWGIDSVTNMSQQLWYTQQPTKSNTWFRRLFCCCDPCENCCLEPFNFN